MLRLGLTGSIGMGKTATAGMFRELGAPVYDADAAVHGIYAPGGRAVGPVSEAFPGVLDGQGGIDRAALRQVVIGDGDGMERLEQIVHPLVGLSQVEFLQQAERNREPYVVLDIPLLFETGGVARCDHVAVVSAPASLQRERVLARQEMNEAQFEAILTKQVPDSEKRARADFVISSAFGFEFARAHVQAIHELMIRLAGGARDD
jgi:dephospho-CoA kinase